MTTTARHRARHDSDPIEVGIYITAAVLVVIVLAALAIGLMWSALT